MTMCDACQKIVQHKRGAKGHEALEAQGTRRGDTPIGQARIDITDYVCRTCGTQWEYENDKNDDHTGWSVK